MMEIDTIGEMIPLPTTPEGWFDYGYTALADGRLVLIRTRLNIHAEFKRWWEAVSRGDSWQPDPKV